MNAAFPKLHAYPFEKLAELRSAVTPPASLESIDLSIGEPKHPTPAFILESLTAHAAEIAKYPTTLGTGALREACCAWLSRRYGISAELLSAEENVIPVNGTREALFAIAHCLIDARRQRPAVVMPNPFYQIYEGAALLAGAEPYYVNCTADHGYLPNFAGVPVTVWERCELVYICTPGNPTGAVMPDEALAHLLALADRYDFVLLSDECYSEIYADESAPPGGLLQAAAKLGRTDFRRCLSFHSLSKRSSVPGMRSGFVAGDAALVRAFARYRTYHGCAMPLHHQAASTVAWSEESHVVENRRLYREKFDACLAILAPVLPVERPPAGFYLWPELPVDDVEFARGLLAEKNVTVLPGSFLARQSAGSNPGAQRARIALVAPLAQCVEAAQRIRDYAASVKP